MRSITRTGASMSMMISMAYGLPYEMEPNSTINESLDDPTVVPFQPTPKTLGMSFADPYNYVTDSANLRVQYLVIGNGGHGFIDDADGIPYTTTYPHKATDAGLFKMIPFVVRPVTDDLPAAVAANYRIRKTLLISGVLYAAYYARKLNLNSTVLEKVIETDANGVKTTTPFAPTVNDLKPTRGGINGTADGSYLKVYGTFELSFTELECRWLREACALVYGNENKAIISEIAICHGVDKPIKTRYATSGTQNPIAVTNSTVNEAVGVQLAVIESTHYPLVFDNGGFSETINIGSGEPLFGVRSQ